MSRKSDLQIPTKGPTLVGTAEASAILNVPRSSIARWVRSAVEKHEATGRWPRATFPQPVANLASGPVWKEGDVEFFRDAREASKIARAEAKADEAVVEPLDDEPVVTSIV